MLKFIYSNVIQLFSFVRFFFGWALLIQRHFPLCVANLIVFFFCIFSRENDVGKSFSSISPWLVKTNIKISMCHPKKINTFSSYNISLLTQQKCCLWFGRFCRTELHMKWRDAESEWEWEWDWDLCGPIYGQKARKRQFILLILSLLDVQSAKRVCCNIYRTLLRTIKTSPKALQLPYFDHF